MRVLVIEDDPVSARMIGVALTGAGIVWQHAQTGEEGIEFAKLYDFDIMILDLRLPDIDGYDVVRGLRSARIRLPVLILSSRSDPLDKVKGLTTGADDFLTKPFVREELVARIQAIVRRSNGHAQATIRTGALVINIDARTAEIRGRRVHFTGKEFAILELLALRKQTPVSKEMFLDHLYGGMDEPDLKIIDVFICKIRKKISDVNDGVSYIETVWGRGYVMKEPEALATAA